MIGSLELVGCVCTVCTVVRRTLTGSPCLQGEDISKRLPVTPDDRKSRRTFPTLSLVQTKDETRHCCPFAIIHRARQPVAVNDHDIHVGLVKMTAAHSGEGCVERIPT